MSLRSTAGVGWGHVSRISHREMGCRRHKASNGGDGGGWEGSWESSWGGAKSWSSIPPWTSRGMQATLGGDCDVGCGRLTQSGQFLKRADRWGLSAANIPSSWGNKSFSPEGGGGRGGAWAAQSLVHTLWPVQSTPQSPARHSVILCVLTLSSVEKKQRPSHNLKKQTRNPIRILVQVGLFSHKSKIRM